MIPYGLIFRGLAILAIMAALAYGIHRVLEHFRNEGRAEIQTLWDADKAARIKRTTEITTLLSGKLMASMDAEKKREGEVNAIFTVLDTRASSVHSGAGVHLNADLAGVLNDAASGANSTRTDAGTKARTDPIPIAAEGATYDERELAVYFVEGPKAYADAYNLWKACREREDGYMAALAKGLAP